MTLGCEFVVELALQTRDVVFSRLETASRTVGMETDRDQGKERKKKRKKEGLQFVKSGSNAQEENVRVAMLVHEQDTINRVQTTLFVIHSLPVFFPQQSRKKRR